jgi:hypothetical protein
MSWARAGWGPVLAGTALFVACDGTLLRIDVSETSTTVIEEASLVETLLGDLGFGDFVALDVTASEELQNQGVAPGDIQDVRLAAFTLVATAPEGADLAFLESLTVSVDAPGLDPVVIARGDSFPAGGASVALDVEDVDLTAYVTSQSLTVTVDAEGGRPERATTVEASFTLSVGVTAQGACKALDGDRDTR